MPPPIKKYYFFVTDIMHLPMHLVHAHVHVHVCPLYMYEHIWQFFFAIPKSLLPLTTPTFYGIQYDILVKLANMNI